MSSDQKNTLDYAASARSRLKEAWALVRKLGPVGPVALISMTVPGVMGFITLGLAKYHEAALHQFAGENPGAAITLYIVGFALLAGFPVLPTYAISLIGGYFLGFKWGIAASLIGYTGASMISFIFLRLLSGDHVERVISEHPKWKVVRDELLIRSPWRTMGIVALLRLPPNLPFAVINLVLVTARTHLAVYLAGSFIGVVPRTLAVTYIASEMKRFGEEGGGWAWMIAGIGLMVAVLALITHIAQRSLRKITEKPRAAGA